MRRKKVVKNIFFLHVEQITSRHIFSALPFHWTQKKRNAKRHKNIYFDTVWPKIIITIILWWWWWNYIRHSSCYSSVIIKLCVHDTRYKISSAMPVLWEEIFSFIHSYLKAYDEENIWVDDSFAWNCVTKKGKKNKKKKLCLLIFQLWYVLQT